ncbi:MAG: GTPase ObgE [Bacteroidia bacterium]|nr:GTPase ObgE [Bacteroidales bacterium]NCD42656.1 GTPase ObgE [Bacteroidia bacterium]MDD2322758.1 GTPase ObgE [Bacteroidales bacterium]MDD3011093.1 GTPase ObgE [Bacteroidales bacterium]MDD3960267.1 GTPase ObgE [Bacteroidales bacterium]
MVSSNFVDYVKINCRSGNGGAGSAHFIRNRMTAFGGPDGGDGGRGGHIILRGNKQMWTLLHLKYTKHIKAEHGGPGGAQLKTGKEGDDVILEVPLGTLARDAETGEVEFEIVNDGEQHILVAGGRGGKGNDFFKSSTMRTPRFAQPGEPGLELWKILELKILADVGLVGFPNAGKSTLLSVISAAKPEIADYPFTTLRPNLGMIPYRNERSFVMADIPGIIEGAHEGKGLGLRFLRHIERNSVLLFMIPVDADNIRKEYEILLHELQQYNPELLDKKRILAITKCDLFDDEMLIDLKQEIPSSLPWIFISSIAGKGLTELKDILWDALNSEV